MTGTTDVKSLPVEVIVCMYCFHVHSDGRSGLKSPKLYFHWDMSGHSWMGVGNAVSIRSYPSPNYSERMIIRPAMCVGCLDILLGPLDHATRGDRYVSATTRWASSLWVTGRTWAVSERMGREYGVFNGSTASPLRLLSDFPNETLLSGGSQWLTLRDQTVQMYRDLVQVLTSDLQMDNTGRFPVRKPAAVDLAATARRVILAPSGAGKSYLCNQFPDLFMDGDAIIRESLGWPEGRWWEYIEQSRRSHMTEAQEEAIVRWIEMDRSTRIVLFHNNAWTKMWMVAGFFIPDEAAHLLNADQQPR